MVHVSNVYQKNGTSMYFQWTCSELENDGMFIVLQGAYEYTIFDQKYPCDSAYTKDDIIVQDNKEQGQCYCD